MSDSYHHDSCSTALEQCREGDKTCTMGEVWRKQNKTKKKGKCDDLFSFFVFLSPSHVRSLLLSLFYSLSSLLSLSLSLSHSASPPLDLLSQPGAGNVLNR